MIPQSNPPQPDSLLADLRETLSKIAANQKANDEQKKKNEVNSVIIEKRQEQALLGETKSLRSQLARKNTQLQQLKRHMEEKEIEISNNYKRQFRHLSDTLVQKQAEIQYLSKQYMSMKNRITSLQQDLNQSTLTRKSLEQSLTKTVELIKTQFKEHLDSKQDQQLTRFMSETNIKQINDKLDALLNICVDLEKKKSFMEDKYFSLKRQSNQQIQSNIKLEVEIEKLKEQLWQEKQIIQSYNQNKQFVHEEVDFFANKSKNSRLSHAPSQGGHSQEKRKINNQENRNGHSQSTNARNMDQTINLLKAETSMLLNFEEKLISLNKKINHDTDIWKQVLTVKELNAELQLELNEVKAKLNPEHEDILIKENYPSLYGFFNQKMVQVKEFEKRVEYLENKAHQMAQTLEQILYNGVPEQQVKPNQNQFLERQNAAKSKLKKEMLQAFEIQKQIVLKDAKEQYKQEIQTLKSKIANLNQEISRLQDKNQNLFNLLEESEKLNKPKAQVKEQPSEIEKSESAIENMSLKIETQSVNGGLNPSQVSHLNYLQEKVQRLQQQLKQATKKIEQYKKQIRRMLDNYKLKNTKNKFERCYECMLGVDQNEDYDSKCQKCKVDVHEGECRKAHEKNCKKNVVTTTTNNNNNNNKPKQKKPQPKLSGFSQRIDYF